MTSQPAQPDPANPTPAIAPGPTTTCPRRLSEMGPWEHEPNLDHWQNRDGVQCCSFCGCLHPDKFMALLEEGAQVIPTDKSYKAYVKELGDGRCGFCGGTGKAGKEGVLRQCPVCEDGSGFSGAQHKFYFLHLSPDQAKRFTDLHNERKLAMAAPGHFYTRPYFWRAPEEPNV